MTKSKNTVQQERTVTVEAKIDGPKLVLLIDNHFSSENVDSLIFELGFDKGNVPGTTKRARIEALIDMCTKHSRLSELWHLCQKERPGVDWESVLVGEIPSPLLKLPKKRSPWLVAGVLIAVLLIGFVVGWLVWGNGRGTDMAEEVHTPVPTVSTVEELQTEFISFPSPLKTENVAIYSFENCIEEAGDWELKVGVSVTCDTTYSYDGQHSLAIRYSKERSQAADLIKLEYKTTLTEDQLMIARVLVPEETSVVIGGGLFLWDGLNWFNGHGIYPLKQGEWVTLAWSTQKAVPRQSNPTIGILLSEYDVETASDEAEGTIYIDQVELYQLPNRHQNPFSQNVYDESYVFSFETASELDQWQPQPEGESTELKRVTSPVFDGRYALAIPMDLQVKLDDSPERVVRIIHKHEGLKNKWVATRIYAPEGAPSNLSAQLFLNPDEGPPVWGQYVDLTPGSWTSIVWNTADAPTWTEAVSLGLMFKLQPVSKTGDAQSYADSFLYIDLVEILPAGDVFPSLDQIVEPVQTFHFEDSLLVPTEITPLTDYYGASHMSAPQISEDESAFYGIRSLYFETNLPPFEPDRNYAGIAVTLGKQLPTDAVSAFVKVPLQNDLEGATNFYVTFWAETEEDKSYFSPKIQVPVGEWAPIFWGTGFANGHCIEEDESGECVEGAFIWDEWHSPEITGLEVRVWRDGEEYVGPIYFDQITFYQRNASTD